MSADSGAPASDTGAGPAPPALAIMDLDGVIADVRARLVHLQRRPKDWDAFFAAIPADPPLPAGVRLAHELAPRHRLVYLSGRPERTRADTEAWLARHGLPAAPLHLRRDGDHRPARLVKLEVVRRLAATHPIAVVVDDDPAVLAALREGGWAVVEADWGRPDPAQTGHLRHVQEGLGRT